MNKVTEEKVSIKVTSGILSTEDLTFDTGDIKNICNCLIEDIYREIGTDESLTNEEGEVLTYKDLIKAGTDIEYLKSVLKLLTLLHPILKDNPKWAYDTTHQDIQDIQELVIAQED